MNPDPSTPPPNHSIRTDLLPRPGTRWCEYEKRALEIRRLIPLRPEQPLDPFQLANLLQFQILRLSELDQLPADLRQPLSDAKLWSGAALRLPNQGSVLILLNDSQSPRRLRATLMEEICHLLLGHPPSRLTPEQPTGRTFARHVEEEAYAIGAAALVPFAGLRQLIPRHPSIEALADHFIVSRALLRYRLTVLQLRHFLPSCCRVETI